MLSTLEPRARGVHRLARFVTREAIALLLNLQPHEIYRIDCWQYVIHVVGKGVSRFVSYADIPPILDVEPPNPEDFACWRKRWRKNKYKAPNFWVEFYKQKFKLAPCLSELYRWGELIGAIKFALSETTVQLLRSIYTEEKYCMDKCRHPADQSKQHSPLAPEVQPRSIPRISLLRSPIFNHIESVRNHLIRKYGVGATRLSQSTAKSVSENGSPVLI